MSDLTKSNSNREQWPDFCKGFGIILVVFGHAIRYVLFSEGTGGEEISVLFAIDKWIYSFHMALFFFVSGYLQSLSEKKGTSRAIIIRKLISIIGPYIVFSFCFWFFKRVFSEVLIIR